MPLTSSTTSSGAGMGVRFQKLFSFATSEKSGATKRSAADGLFVCARRASATSSADATNEKERRRFMRYQEIVYVMDLLAFFPGTGTTSCWRPLRVRTIGFAVASAGTSM